MWTNAEGVVREVDHEILESRSKCWENGGNLFHLCRLINSRAEGKVYVWTPRKPEPKSCPRCRYRFDTPYGEE